MKNGWQMAIETTGGVVGFEMTERGVPFITYPCSVSISNEFITKNLGLNFTNVVSCEETDRQNFIEDAMSNGKRLQIEKYYLNSICLHMIDSHGIASIHFVPSFCIFIKYGTICSIETYRDNFLKLLVEIARITGNIKAIHLYGGDSNVLYTREMFENSGYKFIRNCGKSMYGGYYSNKIIQYYTMDGVSGVEIVLERNLERYVSGNIVTTLISFPVRNIISAEILIELVDKLDNSSGLCDIDSLEYFREISKVNP